MKVTYQLRKSEWTSSQVASGEKNKVHVTHHTFCQNDKSYEAEKSNLPPEEKRMHKLTKIASGETEKFQVSHHTF